MKISVDKTRVKVILDAEDFKKILIEFLETKGLDFSAGDGYILLPDIAKSFNIDFNTLYDRKSKLGVNSPNYIV